jgi:hypothetical protein
MHSYDDPADRYDSAPDPYDGSYDLTNPQSFNRYSYVTNNPLSFIDPSGLLDCKYPPCDPNYGGGTTVYGNVPPITYGNIWVPGSGTGDGVNGGNGTGGGGGGGRGGGNGPGPNGLTPANPCEVSGNAPSPNLYAQFGKTASSNPLVDLSYLLQFRRGGSLDAQVGLGANGQPCGGSPAYANYAYGVYMSAAGYTLSQALAGADIYAQFRSRYPVGTPMAGPTYPFTPQSNVTNITNGFNAQQNGTTCQKPS